MNISELRIPSPRFSPLLQRGEADLIAIARPEEHAEDRARGAHQAGEARADPGDGRALHEGMAVIERAPLRLDEHAGAEPVGEEAVAIDGETARAFTDYVFVTRSDGESFAITSVGRYHDRLVKDHDRWRFAERRIVFLGGEAPEV